MSDPIEVVSVKKLKNIEKRLSIDARLVHLGIFPKALLDEKASESYYKKQANVCDNIGMVFGLFGVAALILMITTLGTLNFGTGYAISMMLGFLSLAAISLKRERYYNKLAAYAATSHIDRRNLVIEYFRKLIEKLRFAAIGEGSPMYKQGEKIHRALVEIERASTELTELSIAHNGETPIKGLPEQQERALQAWMKMKAIEEVHQKGVDLIRDRLDEYERVLGKISPIESVQRIADRLTEIEWQIEDIRNETEEAFLGLVDVLAQTFAELDMGIADLSVYDTTRLEVELNGDNQAANIYLHDQSGDLIPIEELFEATIPDISLVLRDIEH